MFHRDLMSQSPLLPPTIMIYRKHKVAMASTFQKMLARSSPPALLAGGHGRIAPGNRSSVRLDMRDTKKLAITQDSDDYGAIVMSILMPTPIIDLRTTRNSAAMPRA
jgi:hypothetical protein